MQKMIKSLGSAYNKSSLWCKVLILMSLLLLLVLVFKGFNKKGIREGFEQKDQFLVKSGSGIYDDFYADIYDYLVFNNLKDDYEVGYIMNSASPSSQSKILDIGCGTGHHVASIGAKGLDTPAEREFLRQVMTGTISMDKNALIKMTQIRRDIEKRSIDRYNQALQSGELDDYFTSTKRQKKLIDIPDNSGFRIVP